MNQFLLYLCIYSSLSDCRVQHESGLQVPWCVRFLRNKDLLEGPPSIPIGRKPPQGTIRQGRRSEAWGPSAGACRYPTQTPLWHRLGVFGIESGLLRTAGNQGSPLQQNHDGRRLRHTLLWTGLRNEDGKSSGKVWLQVLLVLFCEMQRMWTRCGEKLLLVERWQSLKYLIAL